MTHASEHAPDPYYVPHQSYWPIIASIGLFTLMLGGATVLNGGGNDQPLDLDGPDQLLTLGDWRPLG